MNKEQQQINKAVKKAMGKLVAFSLSDLFEGEGFELTVEIATKSKSIWCYLWTGKDCDVVMLPPLPKTISEIKHFNLEIERAMANIKQQLK